MKTLTPCLAFLAFAVAGTLPAAKPDPLKAAKEIDAILAADWQKNKLKANEPVSDEMFVRRIHLDIAGRIPTYRETEEYMNSKDPAKRQKLIDRLLAGEGYVQNYFNFWADVLRAQSNGQAGAITGTAYTSFIKDSLRTNKPYDQFVREMVASQGRSWENGAIGYYMRDRGMPLDNMANTVRIFLGTRVECAQCHNHPFDKWSQKQFYEMAAFTYGVETNDYNGGALTGVRDLLRDREKSIREMEKAHGKDVANKAREEYRKESRYVNEALTRLRDPVRYTDASFNDRRELRLPHDYQYTDAKPKSAVAPAAMMGKVVEKKEGQSQLEAYAAWMTSRDNPRFTNVVANRLWKKAFGMGLIEPVDELMDNTVAMNPELMKHLEGLMVSLDYDMKAYLRTLYNTRAYQSAVTREEIPVGMPYHFTGPVLRRMSAEQMWDSFVALINPTPDMPNLPVREQAEQRIAAAKKYSDSLDTLTPEEMLKGAEVAGLKFKEQSTKLTELQKQIAQAREDGDKEKVKALGRESNDLQRAARQSVNTNIVVPAMRKLAANASGKTATPEASATLAAVDGAAAPAGPAMADGASMMAMNPMEASMGIDTKVLIPGYDKAPKTDEQIREEREAQQKVLLDEAAYYGIPEKKVRDYAKSRAGQMRQWLRSAEIDSPAPRGHYLREFGQSDRETIENANYDASVPQALAMMNSPLLPQIMDQYSQLMLTINKAPYPDDKVDAAYMTLLSRKPTPQEKEVWNKAQDKGLNTMEDLIYALINTQQFIFIQ
ncbi:DUF1549 domain-containing protein [Verrucomicrobium sp. BvORR106]|uniref:DUF1549 domain-containing protein n=1 Tax=Verrucomicrobium sp. BvORR106 TaxID=1403819 RepID=UPI0006896B44|nr:DUF1549 domain-containing protein [Verrucomicrobium sp. BvORR106]